jgi:hypothetical protein
VYLAVCSARRAVDAFPLDCDRCISKNPSGNEPSTADRAEKVMKAQTWGRAAVWAGQVGFIFLMTATFSRAHAEEPGSKPPPHWFITGEAPLYERRWYSASVDHKDPYEGAGSGMLKSISASADGGSLAQSASAEAYRGKRVRMKAFVRGDDLAGRAGLWIRADDSDTQTVAYHSSFDSLPLRFVDGTTDWKELSITIEIPASAVILLYGVFMVSTGTVYIDNVSFEILGPYTELPADRQLAAPYHQGELRRPPLPPANLDFEE